MHSPILVPLMALVLWTFVMQVWLYATRIPALQGKRKSLDPNSTKEEFNTLLPPHVRWKADNYNHLLEQPTLFYAIVLTLAVVGGNGALNLGLAWGYVTLRVVHSLVQATKNVILIRFGVFSVSSLVLLTLAINAALAIL